MTLYQLLCKLCDGQKIMIEAYSGPITASDFVIYQGNFRVFEKLDPKLNPIYNYEIYGICVDANSSNICIML